MADEFQTGVCSSNWWNSSRNGFTGSSSPCSTGISEMGSFGWVHGSSEMGRSCEESASISGNSGSFQDAHKSQASDSVAGDGTVLMDSTLQMVGFDLSSPTMDWNHALLRSSGRAESNFQSLLQEELSSRSNFHQESPMETTHVQKEWNPKSFSSGSEDSMNTFKQINQGFGFDQQRMNSSSGECIVTCQGLASSNFSMGLASYGCPSTLDQGLIDHDPQSQQTSYENRTIDYSSQINYRLNSNDFSSTWPRYPQFVKTSSPQKQAPNNQLQFSNNTHFWNAMAGAANDATSSFYPPSHTQFPPQSFEERPNSSSTLPAAKANAEGIRDSCSVTKKSSSEPTFKRPRMETPSPLPTFKVRKEKLGDRITALQQLVSPFGKTDTASVLFEAIDYIKFLHEQVSLLSTPYMKNGAPIQHQQNSEKSKDGEGTGQDLRSRGLCLVPISSTFPVTNETTSDFWTPTFGGTFR